MGTLTSPEKGTGARHTAITPPASLGRPILLPSRFAEVAMRSLRPLAAFAGLILLSGCETSTWDGYTGYPAPPRPYATRPYPSTYSQPPTYPPLERLDDGRDGYRGGEDGRLRPDGRGYTPYSGAPSHRPEDHPPAYRQPEYGDRSPRQDESGRYYPPPSPYGSSSPYTANGRRDDRGGYDSSPEPSLLDRSRQRDAPAYQPDDRPSENSGNAYRAPPVTEPDRLQPDLGRPTWQ
jgi:hypothetical protein